MLRSLARHQERHQRTHVLTHEGDLGQAECRQRTGHVLGLRAEAEGHVERSVRLPVSQKIDGERRVARIGQPRGHRAPQEAAAAESMQQRDRRAGPSHPFHVERAGAHWDSKMFGVHGLGATGVGAAVGPPLGPSAQDSAEGGATDSLPPRPQWTAAG